MRKASNSLGFVHLCSSFHETWTVGPCTKFYNLFPQISRCIGDVYLKKAEFNREPLYAKFRLPQPFKRPILSSEPSILVHQLQPQDQFIIFASDGLWEHFSNQEAVDIVQNSPRAVRYSFRIKKYS